MRIWKWTASTCLLSVLLILPVGCGGPTDENVEEKVVTDEQLAEQYGGGKGIPGEEALQNP